MGKRTTAFTKEDLERLYHGEGLTMEQTGERLGVSTGTICLYFKRWGLRKREDPLVLTIPDEELRRMYVDEKLSQGEIADRTGLSESTVRRNIRRAGLNLSFTEAHQRRFERYNATKKKQVRYNGGYRRILMRGHPSARRSDGMVNEHWVVAERMMGRYLKDGEMVHHMNYERNDNSEHNLCVLSSNRDHMLMHRYVEHIGAYMCGFLKERPEPFRPDGPAFLWGQWRNEIDLIGDRKPLWWAA